MTTNYSAIVCVVSAYYSLLATLPVSGSQLLCVRTMLLEGGDTAVEQSLRSDKSPPIVATISGLTAAQLAIAMSVSWPTLCIPWYSPQLLALVAGPYIACYYNISYELRSVDRLYAERSSSTPPLDARFSALFFGALICELMNTRTLPSPFLTRLTSLCLFKSTKPVIVFANMAGWLVGQAVFVWCTRSLLARLSHDSRYPVPRHILQNVVTWLLFATCVVTYSSWFPAPSFRESGPVPSLRESRAIDWHQITWAESLLIFGRWREPCRVQRGTSAPILLSDHKPSSNSRQLRTTHKQLQQRGKLLGKGRRRLAQYWFDTCAADGNRRLLHTAPEGVSSLRHELCTRLGALHPTQRLATDRTGLWLRSVQGAQNEPGIRSGEEGGALLLEHDSSSRCIGLGGLGSGTFHNPSQWAWVTISQWQRNAIKLQLSASARVQSYLPWDLLDSFASYDHSFLGKPEPEPECERLRIDAPLRWSWQFWLLVQDRSLLQRHELTAIPTSRYLDSKLHDAIRELLTI